MKKVIPNLVDVTKKVLVARSETRDQVGTIRADVRHHEQKCLEATVKTEDNEYKFWLDEPGIRGGQGRGVHPLGHFLAGAGG
jgi:hypothetical protein